MTDDPVVRARLFDLADRAHVRIDTSHIGAVADAERPGVRVTPLFRDAREDVRIEHWQANRAISLPTDGGAELLVLAGGFAHDFNNLLAALNSF